MRNPFTFEVEPFEIGGGYQQEEWEAPKGGGAKQSIPLDCKPWVILSGFAHSEYAIRMWHYEKLLGISLPAPVMLVRGHTDNTGKEKENEGLSFSRAFEVVQWLKWKNNDKSPATILLIEGWGHKKPLVPHGPSNHAKNRRVEILWCKTVPPPPPTTGPMAVRRLQIRSSVA